MILSGLIDRMIAAGMSAGEAGTIAAEIYAAGAASVSVRSSNAERQQRYRDRKRRNETVTNRNESVTDCNEDSVTKTVTNRNEPVTSNASAVSPIDTKIKNSKRQNSDRPSRGTRIDPSWTPSEADRQLAKQEGFSDSEIGREALRFRDFWVGKAGAGGVKLDWASTWRNWVRTSADRLGKKPVTSGPASNSVELNWDAALVFFKRTGHWSRHAPRSDISEAPPDLLAKHGLLSDGRPMQSA